MLIEIQWESFKERITQGLAFREVIKLNHYYLYMPEPPLVWYTKIFQSEQNQEYIEYESTYKQHKNRKIKSPVVTDFETNDKTLRTVCAFTETDANGLAEFCIPIPENGRYIAYGDIEFKNREFGDYVKTIEIVDLDRVLAMQIALSINPQANSPVDDETAANVLGIQTYPILGHYDERNLVVPIPENARGTILGGMSMSFQYGITEAQPIGGYGSLPGLMYLRIVAKKKTAVSGQECQLSIDWAEPNATP